MSSPDDMKTGITLGGSAENVIPETFFICYIVLAGILRRNGFKDCLLYTTHNNILYNNELFESGVLFNLLSEYGVGKSLMPLLKELFTCIRINPYEHMNNVFFKEIVRLTPEVSQIIRTHDSDNQSKWVLEYAFQMENAVDDISNERKYRLAELLIDPPDPMNISDDDLDDNDGNFYMDISESPDISSVKLYIKQDTCYCLFCYEFRKYHSPPHHDRDIVSIINRTVISIAKDIHN
uniref:Uncharacterized protein n=1 Tax=Pithovirus LCPAC302 TaxID=2506593 RepID=A0A481Z918_9VIRU|nr:MAG: hypothetical protein LCPAC302_02500 [Pithovirus LCPAC302]